MTAILGLTELKENKAVKKTDGSKTKSIRSFEVIDANNAGTSKSKNCIYLCEGDSAKSKYNIWFIRR